MVLADTGMRTHPGDVLVRLGVTPVGGRHGDAQRSGRKKARTSSTSAFGSSIAAKWPPFGIMVQRCTLKARSAHTRGGLISSFGKMAQPVGTSTRSFGGNASAWIAS